MKIDMLNIDTYVKTLYKSVLLTKLQKYDNIILYQIVSGKFDIDRRIMDKEKLKLLGPFNITYRPVIKKLGLLKGSLWCRIVGLSWKQNYSTMSQESLAKEFKINRKTVWKAIQELIDDKLIFEETVRYRKNGLDHRVKCYRPDLDNCIKLLSEIEKNNDTENSEDDEISEEQREKNKKIAKETYNYVNAKQNKNTEIDELEDYN